MHIEEKANLTSYTFVVPRPLKKRGCLVYVKAGLLSFPKLSLDLASLHEEVHGMEALLDCIDEIALDGLDGKISQASLPSVHCNMFCWGSS